VVIDGMGREGSRVDELDVKMAGLEKAHGENVVTSVIHLSSFEASDDMFFYGMRCLGNACMVCAYGKHHQATTIG